MFAQRRLLSSDLNSRHPPQARSNDNQMPMIPSRNLGKCRKSVTPRTLKVLSFNEIADGTVIALSSMSCAGEDGMTLRIEKASDEHGATIRLIGRMRAEHLDALDKQIRETGPAITLDLEEVTLVDVEIVRFLATCEERGATLLNCSPYICDWIGKERE